MAVKIGLSGGIGSGKSTVNEIFYALGASTYNADQIARQLTQPDTTQYIEIVQLFGKQILDKSAQIDRAQLAEIIFTDRDKRQKLEEILHPAIREELFRLARQCAAPYCILEIPLLFESDLYTQMDRTITINCDQETRIQRLIQARGKSRSMVEKILKAQLTDQQRCTLANDVIENNSTQSDLRKSVEALYQNYQTAYME